MRFAARFTLLAALPLCAVAGDAPGIKPRAGSFDYPVHATRPAVAVGAALLTSEQVRGAFVSDLNRSYAVVEVGVFPTGPIEVAADDFALRVAGSQTIARPASARVVAGVLQKTAPTSQDITVYPQVGIGYESGPRTYDPVTGTTRGGGMRTSVGVGVGVGGSRPASTDDDRRTMEIELSEKGLPEGQFSKPVAGYLYFPLPAKKKPVTYELEYTAAGSKIVLPVRH